MKLNYSYFTTPEKTLIGRLDDYPEYPTEADSVGELEELLLDIYQMTQNGMLDDAQKYDHGVFEIPA
jgi:hypothetical protein